MNIALFTPSSVPTLPDEELRAKLKVDGNGKLLPTQSNLSLIFEHDPALRGLIRCSEFSMRYIVTRAVPVAHVSPLPGPYPRDQIDADVIQCLAYVQDRYSHRFHKLMVQDAMTVAAMNNRIHEVRDYLDNLQWDRVPRLDNWLTKTFGIEPTAYHKAVGSKFLIAAVRRVRQPGCQFDYMPVLEGEQGIRKSTAVAVLFGRKWVTDQIADLGNKEGSLDLCGKWGVEFAELHRLSRSEVGEIRAFITRRDDHYRPPYGRHTGDFPRQCVLIGTTNDSEYLRDDTGGRRFWPVDCRGTTMADVEWLAENRDQLWAEAAFRERMDELTYIADPDIEAVVKTLQDARYVEDPWQPRVAEFLAARPLGNLTMGEILQEALFVDPPRQTTRETRRAGAILKRLGWECTVLKLNGKTVRRWFPRGQGLGCDQSDSLP